MKGAARSLRPAHELGLGGDSARRAFGALVEHLGARYRYFPDFARLEGDALERSLVARAEHLFLELLAPPAQLAALSAYGWGRFDRWIRAHLMGPRADMSQGADDEHAAHRVAQETVLALVEDQRLAATGGMAVTPRALPPQLEAALARRPQLERPEPVPWQLWVTVGVDGVASWVVILALGERIDVLLAHDAWRVVAADEVLIPASQVGLREPLVLAPWCRWELAPESLEGYVLSLAPVKLPESIAPTSRAQAELRGVLGSLAPRCLAP